VNGNDGFVYGALYDNRGINGCYDFDGSNDYIRIPASNDINNIWDGGGTMSFWVRLERISQYDRLFGKATSNNTSGNEWSIMVSGNVSTFELEYSHNIQCF
jgi:hypothetical protein